MFQCTFWYLMENKINQVRMAENSKKKLKIAKSCGNCEKSQWPVKNIWICDKHNVLVSIYNTCKFHTFQQLKLVQPMKK